MKTTPSGEAVFKTQALPQPLNLDPNRLKKTPRHENCNFEKKYYEILNSVLKVLSSKMDLAEIRFI